MKSLLAMAVLLAIWPMGSGKEYHMRSGTNVPAATGIIKIQQDSDNGNTKVDIKVNHLADPATLTPSESAYIVWIRPNGGEAVKQGAIGVDKNLKGELKLATTSKDFDVFITAEQSESVTTPSDFEVLRAHVSPN